MEDKSLISYKWEQGIYELKDMIQLVQQGIINEDQFFEITRYNFNGISLKN